MLCRCRGDLAAVAGGTLMREPSRDQQISSGILLGTSDREREEKV